MTRWIAVLVSLVGVMSAGQAYAQDAVPGQGRVVLTIIPGGTTFFTEGKDSGGPSFGSYDLGGAVTVNFNRFVGVEGEVSGSLGIDQDLSFAGQTANLKSPNLLNYSGNLVISAPNHSSVTPYAIGGVGVKWFTGRWGLRGDYRFIAVQSKDSAPAFFGQETRYGHRVYGAVLV